MRTCSLVLKPKTTIIVWEWD